MLHLLDRFELRIVLERYKTRCTQSVVARLLAGKMCRDSGKTVRIYTLNLPFGDERTRESNPPKSSHESK